MSGKPKEAAGLKRPQERIPIMVWVSGAWVLPLFGIALGLHPNSAIAKVLVVLVAVSLAPLPALFYARRQRRRLLTCAANSKEEVAQLKLQLETVRYRTSRLREELQAADRQARLSHQLTLLGQFTAGFMHEFNNPLAIVTGRLEVLLDEREGDPALCADLEEMLKETRYMSNIASTLLQALRRERGGEIFDASIPQKALREALGALRHSAEAQGVSLVDEIAEAPRVDVPEHVVGEVVRGLLSNAVDALKGRPEAAVWVRLDPYRTAGAKVVIRIEDGRARKHKGPPFRAVHLTEQRPRATGPGTFPRRQPVGYV
jgi:signal transduction histidine kinase